MPLGQHEGAYTGLTRFTPLGTQDAETCAHIARHDPDRELRVVEAHRAMLAEHGPDCTGFFGETVPAMCQRCITDREGYEEQWQGDPYPCLTLRLLAAVYSDHPDYQQEWAGSSR